jgi:DNA-binding LytR/AlgR family response regulator
MKALIIEDEALIARELKEAVEEVADDVEITAILPSIKTARKWFMQNAEPDLIFMDIQLNDGVSFELFEQFQLSCPVIFTTAYDEYAIKAFKKNGVDYLLKPIEADELKRAIGKCRRIIMSDNPQQDMRILADRLPGGRPLYKERFVVHVRNQWVPVETGSIALFYRENLNYLVTFEGERYILNQPTLEEVEAETDRAVFYRANRQFIIHVKAIESVKVLEDSRLLVKLVKPLDYTVEIGRKKAPEFRKWLGG